MLNTYDLSAADRDRIMLRDFMVQLAGEARSDRELFQRFVAHVEAESNRDRSAFSHLIARIEHHFSGFRSELEKLTEAERRYQEDGPVQVVLRGSAVTDTNGDNVSIELGGPSVQRLWELRSLSVGGANWSTTVAGSAEAYVAATDPTEGRNLADMFDQAVALPDLGFYGEKTVTLRAPQRLFVVLVAPTTATQYVIGGTAVDLPDRTPLAKGIIDVVR